MKNIRFLTALVLSASLLHACAGGSQSHITPPVAGPFQRADIDQDLHLNYDEFKNYMAYKASPYPEERAQLALEAAQGNLPMHKRFLALDVNNDGRISYLELGGG